MKYSTEYIQYILHTLYSVYSVHTLHTKYILHTPYSVDPEIRGGSELTSKSHRGKASGRSGRGP